MYKLTALMLALIVIAGCGPSPPPRQRPPKRERELATLDRLLAGSSAAGAQERNLERCMARVEDAPCGPRPDDKATRSLEIRLALDPRYASKWGATTWRDRLDRTFSCANRLYAATGIRWRIASVTPWDPGQQRHALYPLLDRLQRELPADGKSLVLGITVWDERRVYSEAGGEIGLSQRAACVVPSWPRVENDCVILAHELGHLIGARHVPGKQWIMGWAARPFHLPAADPIARVVATYRFHPRNLAVIRVLRRQGRVTKNGLHLSRACWARVRAIDRCWRLR